MMHGRKNIKWKKYVYKVTILPVGVSVPPHLKV